MRFTSLVMVVLVLGAASAGHAAAPNPDAHDRALVKRLGDTVAAFQAIASKTRDDDGLQKTLDNCPVIKKDPSQAFAAIFALLPVLLIDVVNQFRPVVVGVQGTLKGMHPHSQLFRSWLAGQQRVFNLILRFDNHGKKIDYCEAARVMLDKKATAGEIRGVLGIDPATISTLFNSKASAAVQRLNPQMRAFLIAAGMSRKQATTLTK
jgi:hypothetical protein